MSQTEPIFNNQEPDHFVGVGKMMGSLKATRDVPRSALKYFGGKWTLAPWVIAHMPAHRIYVEPFGGAASVMLRKPRSKVEVYNELDDEIVGIFRILQDSDQCRELIRRLRRTPYSRLEYEQAFKLSAEPIERARRAIVRCYMSFHHSALFKAKTIFANARHIHGGSSKSAEWSSYPRTLAAVCRRLRGVIIEHSDASRVIRAQDSPDTLFFVDPPYVTSTRDKSSRSFYRHEMDDSQHVALLTQLRGICGRSMISNYTNPIYDEMLADWQRFERRHYANGKGGSERTEVLWISPAR
jgi:DNA adenine methylase